MNLAVAQTSLSVQEYLEGEPHSQIRHEYLAGQVYAMAGAGEKHNRIAGNLFYHLRAAARGSGCGVFINDMKLRVDINDAFYYPDVLLTCQAKDTDPFFKRFPCLVVEVLSPSTEAIDRREKLIAYRSLPSLQHYLLVAQDQRRIEWHSRDTAGRWLLTTLEHIGNLEMVCDGLAARFTLDDVYEDVRLDGA